MKILLLNLPVCRCDYQMIRQKFDDKHLWLVVSTPLKKYARQHGFIFPNFRDEKQKKSLKPPPKAPWLLFSWKDVGSSPSQFQNPPADENRYWLGKICVFVQTTSCVIKYLVISCNGHDMPFFNLNLHYKSSEKSIFNSILNQHLDSFYQLKPLEKTPFWAFS